jgi:hypothetical protein
MQSVALYSVLVNEGVGVLTGASELFEFAIAAFWIAQWLPEFKVLPRLPRVLFDYEETRCMYASINPNLKRYLPYHRPKSWSQGKRP